MRDENKYVCNVTDKEAEDYAHDFVTGIQSSMLSSMNLNQNNVEASSLNNTKWAIHYESSRRDENRRSSSFQAACFDRLESSCFTNFNNSKSCGSHEVRHLPSSTAGKAAAVTSCYLENNSFLDSELGTKDMTCYNDKYFHSMTYQAENSLQQQNVRSFVDTLSYKCKQVSVSKYGKMCPLCCEINEENANWCVECGKAIISVEIRRYDADGRPQQPCGSLSSTKVYGSNTSPSWNNSYSPPQQQFTQDKYIARNNNSASSDINALMEDMKISCQIQNMPSKQPAQKQQLKSSISFDFENPQFDDFAHDGTDYFRQHAVYRRSSNVGENSSKDKEEFYPFDDLLYPDYAIYYPNLGYALPSSNILSNGVYFQQHPYQNNGLHFSDTPVMKQNTSKKRPNSNKKKRRYTKYKSQASHKENMFSNTDFVKETSSNQPQHVLENKDECHWQLPDEISLHIFSYLPMKDIVSCLQVCQTFNKIASDNVLWNEITLKKHSNLNDQVLMKIAKKKPSSISLNKCNGKNVSINGLRQLFRICSDCLQKLDISSCHGGVFIGEVILLHASARCRNINFLDVSWTNVSNESVLSFSKASQRLVELHLNGCQGITDDCLIEVVNKHGQSLQELEVLGCFKISFLSTNAVSQQCKKLTKLNLGQCHKITNGALSNIAENLKHLEVLDIRGCKQIKDISMKDVAANCQKLKTVIVANCPLITDATLAAIAHHLPFLECIDVCGCGRITDRGVITLTTNCRSIKSLDLSSTKVTHKSVSVVGKYCGSLASLKLSFCHSITDECLRTVVYNCKMLQTLHLYGCKSLRYLSKLVEMNPKLKIERESLR